MMPTPINIQLERAIQQELAAGERVLWIGVPRPNAYARPYWPTAAFGMFFAGFALCWIAVPHLFTLGNASTPHPPVAFSCFGVPFLLVGLCFAASPLWGRWKFSRTVYAITPDPAIVIEGSAMSSVRNVTSYRASQLQALERTQRLDGSGDLCFTKVDAGYAINRQRVLRPRGFIGIENVRDVERLLRKTLLPEAPVA